MIKILKPGKIPDTTKRFECRRCGCIFEADKGDYADRDIWTHPEYFAGCPSCGTLCYVSGDQGNQEEGNADTN